jgi:FtsH-binding integral membrane protein
MYADRLPLPSAWRELWRKMRDDPAAFAVYILLRFVLSVGVSVAVLLFLVPLLVGVFSGAVIIAAVVVLALHLVGLTWVWSLSTITLALVALLLLCAVLVILLSAAGMPGQVFLQDFGLRFITARSPSLKALYSTSGEGEMIR